MALPPLDEYTKIIGRSSQMDLKVMSMMSKSWFREEAIRLKKIRFNKRRFIISNSDDVKKRITIGRLYLFEYYPKGVDTLPVWDRFPLCLPFRGTDKGFYGINLHYLTYFQRAYLLERLVRGANKSSNRLRVSWEILNSFSRVPVAEHATKQYLLSQVQSPFKLIEIEDYTKAIMMPMAEYYGEEARKFRNRY